MKAFIKVHPKIAPTIKNQPKDPLRLSQKLSALNRGDSKILPKEYPNECTKPVLTLSNMSGNLRDSLGNHTKRTTDLLNKISNKQRISHNIERKKNNAIQKFLEKMNKQKIRNPFRPIKMSSSCAQKENNQNICNNATNVPMYEDNKERDILQADFFESYNDFNFHHKIKEQMNENLHEVVIDEIKEPSVKEELKNPQFVDEYQEEIWETLINEQNSFMPNPNYMNEIQTDINDKMRLILLDWIIEVHLKYKLKPETFYLAVSIIDRYLSIKNINRQYLQLLGIAAVFSASKYEEIYAPEAKDLIFMTDNAYKKIELIHMENKVLKELKFDLTINTPLKYLDFFIIYLGIQSSEKIIKFTHFLLELSYICYNMVGYNPCYLAASCLYMACIVYGDFEDNFYQKLVFKSGYTKNEILVCVKDIMANLVFIKDCQYNSVVKKYQLSKYLNVASNKLWDEKGNFVYELHVLNLLDNFK